MILASIVSDAVMMTIFLMSAFSIIGVCVYAIIRDSGVYQTKLNRRDAKKLIKLLTKTHVSFTVTTIPDFVLIESRSPEAIELFNDYEEET